MILHNYSEGLDGTDRNQHNVIYDNIREEIMITEMKTPIIFIALSQEIYMILH